MTKAESILKNYKPTIQVGQVVRFGSPWHRREGVIIEDRGPLGFEGRQIVRIRYKEDIAGDGKLEELETETRAEDVEVINSDTNTTQTTEKADAIIAKINAA